MNNPPDFQSSKVCGMVRIGLAHYNTSEEVDRLLSALQAIAAGA